MAIQFLYNNFSDTSTSLLTSTSQEANFPDDNIINTDRNKPWRTPTSGGYFNISAGTRFIDFISANGSVNAANISIGAYSLGSLRDEIIDRMNTVSSVTKYNVTFGSDFRWIIQRDSAGAAGSLAILWNSGANAANSIGRTLGYSTSANDSTTTGTLTADDRAIHTYEFVQFDLGSARTVSAIAIIDTVRDGILIQTNVNSGTVRWQGSDTEVFTSLTIDLTLTIQNKQYVAKPTGGTGTIPSARYWRILISDPRNSDGYVQLGYASFGVPFEPTSTDVSPDWEISYIDPSPSQRAIGGQLFFDKRDQYKSTKINLPLMSNPDHDQMLEIFSITGLHQPFFLLIDPTLSVSANLGELTLFGRFKDNLILEYKISDLYDLRFDFEESL